jgi:hypothetical protein
VVIPALLAFLAVLDAAFAGFRAAAGRDGRIFKRAYYRHALALGAASGAALVAALAALTVTAFLASGDAAALYAELLRIGARMLQVIFVYVALVLAALALYATARLELRALATVSVLGPFTLLRPWIVVAATAWGVTAARGAVAVVLTVVSSGSVLLVGRILEWRYARAGVKAP